MENNQTVETYVCSMIDILGQKEKLQKLNRLILPKEKEEVKNILQKTYGSIKKFRMHMNGCTVWVNEIIKNHRSTTGFSSNNIKSTSFSDLITTFVSLRDDTHKLQFESIYSLLLLNGIVFLQMLSEKIALRGGIDIGIGINHDNEIYGSALLNPYLLESNIAKSIRIVIGQELYEYIETTASSPIISNAPLDYNIEYAKLCMNIIKKDSDDIYILDYLSSPINELDNFNVHCNNAKEFLENSSKELKRDFKHEVAKKYDLAIKYFNLSGIN